MRFSVIISMYFVCAFQFYWFPKAITAIEASDTGTSKHSIWHPPHSAVTYLGQLHYIWFSPNYSHVVDLHACSLQAFFTMLTEIVFKAIFGYQFPITWYRADSRLSASQEETLLQSNGVSHWLGANLESALWYHFPLYILFPNTTFGFSDINNRLLQIFNFK